jgi:voltage-gated potassium channel Kch
MTHQPTLKQRWQYWFDNFMSKGTPAMIGGLFLLAFVIILIISAIVIASGAAPEEEAGRPLSLGQMMWFSMMRTLDSGTMGGDTGAPAFVLSMLAATLSGVFVVSALIGVLNNGLEDKLEELRKGRSLVLENKHTVILGWSPQVFTVISELIEANANQRRAVIVILADQDKIEMEDEIADRIADLKTTRIICRTGSPIDLSDLEIASPHAARAIIILPPEGADPDAYVIKATLALTNNPNRHAGPYHIVTQICEARNMDVIKMIGAKDDVHAVLMGDLVARIIAQTSRQSGLSVVYTELLNFGGDEIYFKNEPALAGKTFAEALSAFEDSSVIGLQQTDGRILLNPPMDTQFGAQDKIIAVSADDDTIKLSGITPQVDAAAIHAPGAARAPEPEKGLILCWNSTAATIINELDHYVPHGSHITVVAEKNVQSEIDELCKTTNQKVTFRQGDTTDRALLDDLNVSEYQHVIVLSPEGLDVQAADARTLITLLHLRDIAEKNGVTFSIVSEVLDLRNRELAEAARVDDFIVSDHLISLLLSQLSENGDLYDVFTDLFDPEGSELYLKPIGDYVTPGQSINFHTLIEAACQRGETPLGYRIEAESHDAGKAYGIHTNPKKSEQVTFAAADKIIVLAES